MVAHLLHPSCPHVCRQDFDSLVVGVVLRGDHFLRCFWRPGPPTTSSLRSQTSVFQGVSTSCANRQPSAPSGDLDLVHAQAEHHHENYHEVHIEEDLPTMMCRGRIHCCMVHRRIRCIRCARCLSRLSRSCHRRNHPKPLKNTVGSMPTTFSSLWLSRTSCPCRPC